MSIGSGLALAAASFLAAEQTIDHTAWDQFLQRSVKDGLVDYRRLQKEEEALAGYLASLQDVDLAQLSSREAQLAFWINAYNACVVKGVLDHSPLTSVKAVKGFFDNIRYRIGGESLTLNEIEAKGRALGDWRIHFAVVCASSSCPSLRSEAYVPDRLEAQLTEQTSQFLRHPSTGLRLDATQRVLWVSNIFRWYAKDFVPSGALTVGNLLEVIGPYVEPSVVQAIGRQRLKLKFLEYDWTLNAQSS